MTKAAELIDDLRHPAPRAANGQAWELVSDRVMGGVSGGVLERAVVAGRPALRLRGTVRLENNGGFLQCALDLGPQGAAVDASGWQGVALTVCGNGEDYNLHLRSTDLDRPWQSFRHSFTAAPRWQRLHLPFADFTAHRTDQPLRPARLRRLGLVAIGRAFEADLAVADIRFYAAEG
ncbi:CIA30 family protein [Rhodobacteraceae bacterium 2376]|uniref:CIA30 family protein n=1 Tax=Rhabdonatronobacter sediminivivens TaxID=2743469 RepID=A0A7Z0KVX0_9RHOB|nr:CIA30 family protein [Rhabdonatronobacter sediminivivens]NYS23374.1 CIA30 family protein [Rhabdonatronobacter sediminivivens]